MKCDIFISYRRDGGDMTAMYIYQALKERGYNVFYDLEVLRAGKFNDALLENIRACRDFVLILSPHALDRCDDENDWVRREIAEALKQKKNIIPVMLNGFVFPEHLPADIDDVRYQNGLSATTEYFVESINRLCSRYLDSKPKKRISPFAIAIAALLLGMAIAGAFFIFSGGEPSFGPAPTSVPTSVPTAEPTPIPTAEPTSVPTAEPTPDPRSVSQRVRDEAGIVMLSGTDLPQMRSGVLRPEYNDPDLYCKDMVFGNEAYVRDSIRTVTFFPTLESMGEDAWDVSLKKDQSVMAWAEKNGDLYDLYIAGEGGVKFSDPVEGESMDYTMFAGCRNLEAVNFNGCVDFSEVTTMRAMFEQCLALKTVDLRGLDTSNVKDMNAIFLSCPNLEAVDLTGMDTSSATEMNDMFKDCPNLKEIDVSSFVTSRVVTMADVFRNCESLESLDLSSWDVSSVRILSGCFNGCINLQSLDVSTWNTDVLSNMNCAFAGCVSLKELDLRSWTSSHLRDMGCAFVGCESLEKLLLPDGFVTGRVTNADQLFNACRSLEAINTTGWDTGSIQSMEMMFCSCSSLTQLDVSGFDTSGANNMAFMFNDCQVLEELDVSGFDTSRVTTMEHMFANCPSLQELKVDGFDTVFVTTMSHMFAECRSLKELDVSGWNTMSVKDTSHMFANCGQLRRAEISGWDLTGLEDHTGMFEGCADRPDRVL